MTDETYSPPQAANDADDQRQSLRARHEARRRQQKSDRGQSELLGGILLFGLLVALLVLIQVAAVPTWNQALEFEHSQQVEEDFQRMGQIMSDIAGDGGDRSIAMDLGVRYPTRPFLFNPPPANGQIATTTEGNLTIKNSELVGVDNYWQTDRTFQTRSIEYEASYNEYDNAPVSTYEYGTLVNEFQNGYNRSSETLPVVDGTNINLLLVNGRLAESKAGTVTIPVEGASAPSNGVKLQSRDGSPIVITLPTEHPGVWQEALSDEENVVDTTLGTDEIEIELNGSKTYNLRMAKMTVGTSNADEGAEYITTKGDSTRVVARNTTNDLTVEVRDKYNNPVSGVEVSFGPPQGPGASGATLQSTTATTGEDGEASVGLETLDDATVTVEARINGGGAARERTTFTVEAVEGGIRATGGGPGGPGAEDGVSTLNPEVIELTDVDRTGNAVSLDFQNNFANGNDYRVNEVRVSFYFDSQNKPAGSLEYLKEDSTVVNLPVGFTFTPVSGETIANGDTETIELEINANNGAYGSDFFFLSIEFQNIGDPSDTPKFSYLVSFQ